MFAYIVRYMPFKHTNMNNLELMHEGCIFTVSVIHYAFLMFDESSKVVVNCGWLRR